MKKPTVSDTESMMNTFQFFDPSFQELSSTNISGERIRLVALSEKFAQDVFQEFTSEVTRYMFPKPPDKLEETLEFIHNCQCGMSAGNDLVLAILLKQTNEFLGCCGLHGEENVRQPELGVWLKMGAHGHGYGREAVTTLVKWAKTHIDLDGFVYPVDRKNIASCKIPESLGGKVIDAVQVTALSGNVLDEIIYKIPISPTQ